MVPILVPYALPVVPRGERVYQTNPTRIGTRLFAQGEHKLIHLLALDPYEGPTTCGAILFSLLWLLRRREQLQSFMLTRVEHSKTVRTRLANRLIINVAILAVGELIWP
jgi:hypothetical protein